MISSIIFFPEFGIIAFYTNPVFESKLNTKLINFMVFISEINVFHYYSHSKIYISLQMIHALENYTFKDCICAFNLPLQNFILIGGCWKEISPFFDISHFNIFHCFSMFFAVSWRKELSPCITYACLWSWNLQISRGGRYVQEFGNYKIKT